MFEEFALHNQFNESIERYRDFDPQLRRIHSAPLIYHSNLLNEPSFHAAGIYLITGGRQLGKTTFLKQFILKLLTTRHISPSNVLFLTAELINTHDGLRRLVEQFFADSAPFQYLFIDEINYIPDWDIAIKYLADAGLFEKMSVIITGSDSQIIKVAMKRFAGRRGRSDCVDFVFHPLSFKEFVCLKAPELKLACLEITKTSLLEPLPLYEQQHDTLTALLYEYLLHGGYLPAITDFELTKTISIAVMRTYIEWIVGDILKNRKSEHYLLEILKGIIVNYNSQISWNSIGKLLAIEHHQTIADYCHLLEDINVIHIQEAIIEHRLTGAPKKNRKLYFRDPFIHHAVAIHLDSKLNIAQIKASLQQNEKASAHVEAVVINHCKRQMPTYYLKGNKGEVDVACVIDNQMLPIEVKWTNQIRPDALKQISLYQNGIVLTPRAVSEKRESLSFVSLVRFLIQVSDSPILGRV